MSEITCKKCINSTINPAILIQKNGLCKTCDEYQEKLDKLLLKKQLNFLKTFIKNNKYDAMVGISGGKDSAATLFTVKEMGFTPLAFTFDIGYTKKDMFSRSKKVSEKIKTDFKVIDIRSNISKNDRNSFRLMAEVYSENDSPKLKKKFRDLYLKGRKIYSTRDDIAFPYLRPCQICRKVVIRSYYDEAIKHNVSIIFIGINEWTGLNDNKFTAIRKLQPFSDKPAVYVVHLPFLLQRNSKDIIPILKKINWEKPAGDSFIETGASGCYLARACEEKAERMLGFHMDSTRLSREITAGFITKEQAEYALHHYKKSTKSVRRVLEEAEII